MIVKRFFEPLLAQTSYLIGCGATGQAIVIDANRDVSTYVDAAAAEDLEIAYVTETHIHADFLSGSRDLARVTGATLLLSDEGDADWKYAFASEGRLIRTGEIVKVGNVRLEAVHTPGHTPEHLTFLVTDGAVADVPIAALTGDFIFVGDVGRPDLLERAANMKGTMEVGARTLYQSLQRFNARHEDWLQIWPGHGAGSSCGKGISAVPHSTLGYERRFNWAFKVADEEEFVAGVLSGQPDPPKYFATMKRMNKQGPALLGGRFAAPPPVSARDLAAFIAQGGFVIDARPSSEYAAGFLPGTLNIPLTSTFVTWAGWLVPYTEDVIVILSEGAELRVPELVRALALIGLDRVTGFCTEREMRATGVALGRVPQVEARTYADMRGDQTPVVIDVRNDAEWASGHLPAALHIPLGRLTDHLADIPRGQPLLMQCQSGRRSAIAASVLRRAGFDDVSNMVGGYESWVREGLAAAGGRS